MWPRVWYNWCMQANKTQPVDDSVEQFIDAVPNEQRRRDSREVLTLMHAITGLPPVMWGTSIVGFGSEHYKYESGREGDMPIVSFAPRKNEIVLYSVLSYDDANLIETLGPHTTGKGCLYIKDLSKVDTDVLGQMIDNAFKAKSA